MVIDGWIRIAQNKGEPCAIFVGEVQRGEGFVWGIYPAMLVCPMAGHAFALSADSPALNRYSAVLDALSYWVCRPASSAGCLPQDRTWNALFWIRWSLIKMASSR